MGADAGADRVGNGRRASLGLVLVKKESWIPASTGRGSTLVEDEKPWIVEGGFMKSAFAWKLKNRTDTARRPCLN